MSGRYGDRPSPGRSTVYTANPSCGNRVAQPVRGGEHVERLTAAAMDKHKIISNGPGRLILDMGPVHTRAGRPGVRSHSGEEVPLAGDDDRLHRSPLAPDLAGGLDQQLELGPLLVEGQRVALDGGG